MKIRIFTAHHKEDSALSLFKDKFEPIQVGSAISNVDLGILKDDYFSDNISERNKYYSELTAYYHIWKNYDYQYAGLMHYRRVFTTEYSHLKKIKKKLYFFIKSKVKFKLNLFYDYTYTVDNINDLQYHTDKLNLFLKSKSFLEYDVIVPKKIKFKFITMKEQYSLCHNRLHLELFNEIISNRYPELKDVIDKVNNSNDFYPRNMFIMKRKYFDEYHDMLFTCLFEFSEKVNIENENDYQKRIFGFISERFFNYYIEYKKDELKIKELATVFFEDK